MFVPAPATMRVGDILETFSESDGALFVKQPVDGVLGRGEIMTALDLADVDYDYRNNMLRLDEVLVRVR